MTTDLVPAEAARLAELEAVVTNGLNTFVAVGRALAEIRDGRLYRTTHGTFEAYCERQWNLSRPRAYQLIEAATVTEALSTNVDTPAPVNEGQARQLTGLPVATAAEVMRKAHDDTAGRVTATAIRQAREVVSPRPAPSPLADRIARELAASDDSYAETAAEPVLSSAVSDYLESSPGLRDSGYVRQFMAALARSNYRQFDAERLASLLDEDAAQAVYREAASATRFADTLRRGRSGLRVINGGS